MEFNDLREIPHRCASDAKCHSVMIEAGKMSVVSKVIGSIHIYQRSMNNEETMIHMCVIRRLQNELVTAIPFVTV